IRWTCAPARSAGVEMSSVDRAGLITTRTLRANTRRVAVSMSPFCWSASICRCAAEMKRSTGAPASICFCSSPDEPKLERTVTPAWLCVNCRPSVSTASFMLIATENVISCAVAMAGSPSSTKTAIHIRRARGMDPSSLARSVASDDDARGFDDGIDVVTGCEAKIFDGFVGDRGGDYDPARDSDADICGRRALLHLDALPPENVTRAQLHDAPRQSSTRVLWCDG